MRLRRLAAGSDAVPCEAHGRTDCGEEPAAIAARPHVSPSSASPGCDAHDRGGRRTPAGPPPATLQLGVLGARDQRLVDRLEQLLEAIDKTLIPSAQNAELKALLVAVRPAFVAHLDHARHIQATLKKG